MSVTFSYRGLRAFLCSPGNAPRLAEARPVARELVLWLVTQDGASDVSEMELARRLGRTASAVSANLRWLETEGALIVQRRSSGGLRLASARRLDVRGCFRLFASVLGRVASSVSRVLRGLRARRRLRAMRELPSERALQNCHTPAAVAEGFKQSHFFFEGPLPDAMQRLLRHGKGEMRLAPDRVAADLSEVAREWGWSLEQAARECGVIV